MVSFAPPRSCLRGVSPPPISATRSRKRGRPEDEVEISASSPQRHTNDPVHVSHEHGQRQGCVGTKLSNVFISSQTPQSTGFTPTPAAIESGQAAVADPLEYFVSHYSSIRRARRLASCSNPSPHLSLSTFSSLFSTSYQPVSSFWPATGHEPTGHVIRPDNNLKEAPFTSGSHFVVHQHDHPQAGLHYDLRLQINGCSSISWAVPYGLPGNPKERHRHGRRQAIETRVHELANHLVESASSRSGSTLIWDTGRYEVLPYNKGKYQRRVDVEGSSSGEDSEARSVSTNGNPASMETSEDGQPLHATHSSRRADPKASQQAKLCAQVRQGKIRVRLHGAKLPPDYTISMSLSRRAVEKIDPNRAQKLQRKRNVDSGSSSRLYREAQAAPVEAIPDSPGGASIPESEDDQPVNSDEDTDSDYAPESDSTRQRDMDLAWIAANNAYPGAVNNVSSQRGRWWFLFPDWTASGFRRARSQPGTVEWVANTKQAAENYPFLVKGREHEVSVVTGRKADQILRDEGVTSFSARRAWQPVVN